jgi:hypothetical protein
MAANGGSGAVNIDGAAGDLEDLQRAQRSRGQCADTRSVAVAEIRHNIDWHEGRGELFTPPVEHVVPGLGCDHVPQTNYCGCRFDDPCVICIPWTVTGKRRCVAAPFAHIQEEFAHGQV